MFLSIYYAPDFLTPLATTPASNTTPYATPSIKYAVSIASVLTHSVFMCFDDRAGKRCVSRFHESFFVYHVSALQHTRSTNSSVP